MLEAFADAEPAAAFRPSRPQQGLRDHIVAGDVGVDGLTGSVSSNPLAGVLGSHGRLTVAWTLRVRRVRSPHDHEGLRQLVCEASRVPTPGRNTRMASMWEELLVLNV